MDRPPTPCIEWQGCRTPLGYGRRIWREGGAKRHAYAHRWAWELVDGAPLPAGMTLDHLCTNPPCIATDHMEVVTLAENARRMHARTTHCKRGHEFTEENTKWSTEDGHAVRRCRTCARMRDRLYSRGERVA